MKQISHDSRDIDSSVWKSPILSQMMSLARPISYYRCLPCNHDLRNDICNDLLRALRSDHTAALKEEFGMLMTSPLVDFPHPASNSA